MKTHLMIRNAGLAPIESFTILGLSTARGKADMIGQFGSGSKHGILTLLRLKIPFRVFIGQDELSFTLNGGKMLDKEYEEVRFVFRGEEHRTGTCLDFGALDWTKSNMALREFICNALDQGELIDNAVTTVSTVEPKADETRIFVELVPDVVDYFTNLDVHFLHRRRQQNDSLLANNTPDIRVYRKDVFVCATRFNHPALFHYNFTDGKIDESRNMDSANVSSLAARLIENDSKALSEIFGTFEQAEVWEHHVGSSVRYWQDPTKNAVRTAWKLAHGDKPFVGSTEMKERLAKKGIDSVVAPLMWTGVLEECKVPYGAGLFNALESSKLESFPATEAACATFRRAWQWIKRANLTGGKDFPRIGCFSRPMDAGCDVQGLYDTKTQTCYLSVDFDSNEQIALEELAHYITGSSDCTRDFQDFAFRLASRLAKLQA